MEKKNKKKAIIITCVIIGIIATVVAISTYAFWQVSKSQSDTNDIVAMCLDINLSSDDTGLSISNAWPTSDEDGLQNAPVYTFSITNNCSKDVSYLIGLRFLHQDLYDAYGENAPGVLSDKSIKLALDGGVIGTLNDYFKEDGYLVNDWGGEGGIYGYQFELKEETIPGSTDSQKSVITHKIQMWIDENASVEEQGKAFTSRVTITSLPNQNEEYAQATREECFQMTDDGKIYGYDATCGTNVVIPNTINGKVVKTIGQDAFKNVTYVADVGCTNNTNTATCVIVNQNYFNKLAELKSTYPTRKFYLITDSNLPDFYDYYAYKFNSDGSIDFTSGKQSRGQANNVVILGGLKANESLKVSKVDFSNVKSQLAIESEAFSTIAGSSGHTGLDDVKFSFNNLYFMIKKFAFSGLKATNLTLYPFSIVDEQAFTKIDLSSGHDGVVENLYIKAGNVGRGVVGDVNQAGTVNFNFDFPVKNVIVEEGIERINNIKFDNQYSATVSLPSTVKEIYGKINGTTLNINKEKYDDNCKLSVRFPDYGTNENDLNWLPSTKTCP